MNDKDQHIVLLVEDEVHLALLYEAYLQDEPYDFKHVGTGKDALAIIDSGDVDVLILDINLPDMNGLEILEYINNNALPISVIVITAHGSIKTAVTAMRNGASDFLLKPFDPERFIYTIRNTFEHQELNRIVTTYREVFDRHEYEGFIGSSLIMQAVYKTIDSAAPSSASVFITGESGTGKEVCAEAIHARSNQNGNSFVALNCASIPKDLMESEIFAPVKGAFTGAASDRDGAATLADGGTLFLDEICEMEQALQAKLLRFVQTSTFQRVGSSRTEKVDVRFICATNKDVWKEVEAGRFREDLYFRLHVIPISLPPLRNREDDILEIAEIFLQQYTQEEGKQFTSFDNNAREALLHHPWPGNVRELQNTLRNAVVLNDGVLITESMLFGHPQDYYKKFSKDSRAAYPVSAETIATLASDEPSRTMSARDIEPLWYVEQRHINMALEVCAGNVARAAAMLEIGASTLYRKLKEMEEN
ncbi:MAG: sigma-54-dependent Fis family transcriptional regulator [Rhodospirillales bacterium]|nr:sigma-54-dependent Fis family transcriptional regulator [Rhodospirillales bacterium]